MPEQDLTTLIRSLSPGALSLFKRQLVALPESERQRAFSRLSGIAELSDIVGRPSPVAITEKQPERAPAVTAQQAEIPLWQQALQKISEPFNWISEHITEPFGAVVTSPFTPTVGGTIPGESWLARERQEYEQWQEPTMTMPWGGRFKPTKGIVETLPWFALPTAAGVLGRVAGVGVKGVGLLGLAQKGGQLGRAAGLAAKVVKPIAAVEAVPGKIIGGAIGKVIPKKGKIIPERGIPPTGVLPSEFKAALSKVEQPPVKPPVTPEVTKTLPAGWRMEIGKTRTKEGVTAEAEVAWSGKKVIYFRDKESMANPLIVNHEIAHIRIDELSDTISAKLHTDYAKLKASEWKTKGYEPEWIVKNNFHKEEIAIDYGQYLTDPSQLRPEIKSFFDKELPEVAIPRAPVIPEVAGKILPKGGKLPPEFEAAISRVEQPPIKPPKPPVPTTAVGAVPEPTNFDRFWELISGKKAIEREAARQATMKAARAEQATRITARLEKVAPEKLTMGEFQRIWIEESKPLLKDLTKMGFPGEFRDEGVRRIRETLLAQNVSEFEIKATVTAFRNALDGRGVPRRLGVKGGSAYTRLERVFGKEAVDILSSPSKLEALTTKAVDWTAFERGLFGEEFIRQPPTKGITRLLGLEEPALLPSGKPLIPEHPWTPPGVTETRTLAGQILDRMEKNLIDFGKGSPEKLEKLYGAMTSSAEKLAFVKLFRRGGRLFPGEAKRAEEGIVGYFRNLPPDEIAKQLAMLPKPTRAVIEDTLRLAGANLLDAANVPRATMSSLDWSAIGRQGAIAAFRHPTAAAKNVLEMARATLYPKYAQQIEREILAHPSVQKFLRPSLDNQLYLAPLPEKITGLLIKEESYATNLAMRLPLIGPIIRGSARAFVTFLNLMRAHMAIDMDAKWMQKVAQAGFKVTDLDYSETAKLINWSTGRGDIPFGLNKYAVIANATLFSPKLFFSRFEWPTMILSPSREVRVEAWKQIGSFLGAVSSILLAAQTAGVGKIELDPRSADFGKLRYGNTRLDIWTGYAQYIKLMAQLATGQRKTEGGYLQPLSRGEIIGRFMTSKLSPAAGLLNDILKGQTYLGEEFPAKSATGILGQVYQRTFPLAMQDMVDGFVQEGAFGGLASSVGIFGVGVVTYMDEAKRERDRAAQKEYGITWEEVGKQLGRAAQLRLEQTTPAILKAEQEMEKRYAVGSPTTMQQWQNEGQAIEDAYRKEVNFAVNEFRDKKDGTAFRERVDGAAKTRRDMYSSRATRKEYQDIVAYYNQPLKPEQLAKMNPGDVLRREYNQQMFSIDMYDLDTNEYDFDKAELREREFLVKYGQQALDYIEEYQGARWADEPVEMKMLKQAREVLRPYWQITDAIWNLYPPGLQDLSDRIQVMERTDPIGAKRMIRQYPQILRARLLIARYKKQIRLTNPAIQQAYRMFYGY